jgi:glycosyltransferase involved in cell wall biosynthesis
VGAALGVPTRIAWYHTISTANREDARVPPWHLRLLELRKALVYRAATHIVANSEAARRDAVDAFWIPDQKVSFFYNSIPEPPTPDSSVERATDKLVCVGRLSANKGQRTVVEALARMKNRSCSVTFVGDGPIRGELEGLASALGVLDRCVFAGYQIARDLWKEVRSATICVVPSLYEAFGLVSVEAMSVATPLVVSATGGSVEIARSEREALHFTPGDADGLARQLDRLLADAELQRRLGQAGRVRFLEVFEQSAAVKRLATWSEQVTERRS